MSFHREDALPFWRLASGTRTGVERDARTLLVLDDEMAWEAFWLRHTRRSPDPGPPPEVDFDDQWVAVALAGSKPTGGYGIRIRAITYDSMADAFTVHVHEETPGDDAVVTQALTAPYDVVRTMRIADTPPMAEDRDFDPDDWEGDPPTSELETGGAGSDDEEEDDERGLGEFRGPGEL